MSRQPQALKESNFALNLKITKNTTFCAFQGFVFLVDNPSFVQNPMKTNLNSRETNRELKGVGHRVTRTSAVRNIWQTIRGRWLKCVSSPWCVSWRTYQRRPALPGLFSMVRANTNRLSCFKTNLYNLINVSLKIWNEILFFQRLGRRLITRSFSRLVLRCPTVVPQTQICKSKSSFACKALYHELVQWIMQNEHGKTGCHKINTTWMLQNPTTILYVW